MVLEVSLFEYKDEVPVASRVTHKPIINFKPLTPLLAILKANLTQLKETRLDQFEVLMRLD